MRDRIKNVSLWLLFTVCRLINQPRWIFIRLILSVFEKSLVTLVESITVNVHMQRERNVLFNDALNTFYLRLHGVRHMVKDHSDSEKGNPLPPHRLLFPISSKGSFICTIPQTG